MRKTLTFSLSIHALPLLAVAGIAGMTHEVSMPWVAAVSISNPATPPGAAAISLPEPVRVAESQLKEIDPPARADFVDLVKPTPEGTEPVEPPPPIIEHAPTEVRRPSHSGELVRRPPPQEPPPPEAAPPERVLPEETNPEAAQTHASAGQSTESAPRPAASAIDSTSCDHAPVMTEVSWPRMVERLYKGTVLASAVVDREGKLTSLELLEGTGRANWDASLLASIRAATFTPATLAGMPVTCRHKWRITFTDED